MRLADWRPGARLSEVGEVQFLAALQRHLAQRNGAAVRAPFAVGDDAAQVAGLSRGALLTSDMLVEDVDFRLAWARWADIGHKAATVNLSDIAAMGGTPRALLASVAIPPPTRAADALALLLSLDAVGRKAGAPLVGGDVSATAGPVAVSVTALGATGRHVWCRHRGRLGDVVCVTAPLGAAGAGLALLESPQRFATLPVDVRQRLSRAQRRPTTPSALAAHLSDRGWVTSAADISDGLVRDALHVAGDGLGVVLDTSRIPVAAGVRAAATLLADGDVMAARTLTRRWALSHGEEYSLVLSVAPRHWQRLWQQVGAFGAQLWPVGRVVRAPGLSVWPTAPAGAPLVGYAHFATGNA